MTHISKRAIKKDVAVLLADQLLDFFSAARTKGEARMLAGELLSQTERVMLAKRLAIVVLLTRGYSYSQIEVMLRTTRQTVARIAREVEQGQFKRIVRRAKERTDNFKRDSFWQALDQAIKAIHLGMPPRAGRRTWRESPFIRSEQIV